MTFWKGWIRLTLSCFLLFTVNYQTIELATLAFSIASNENKLGQSIFWCAPDAKPSFTWQCLHPGMCMICWILHQFMRLDWFSYSITMEAFTPTWYKTAKIHRIKHTSVVYDQLLISKTISLLKCVHTGRLSPRYRHQKRMFTSIPLSVSETWIKSGVKVALLEGSPVWLNCKGLLVRLLFSFHLIYFGLK